MWVKDSKKEKVKYTEKDMKVKAETKENKDREELWNRKQKE